MCAKVFCLYKTRLFFQLLNSYIYNFFSILKHQGREFVLGQVKQHISIYITLRHHHHENFANTPIISIIQTPLIQHKIAEDINYTTLNNSPRETFPFYLSTARHHQRAGKPHPSKILRECWWWWSPSKESVRYSYTKLKLRLVLIFAPFAKNFN